MRYRAVLVLVLAGAALGAETKLKDLFQPDSKYFPLEPYQWSDWRELDKATKLRSRGIDPAEWADPPPDPPPTEEEKKRKEEEEKRKNAAPPRDPEDRYAGFKFDKRLEAKKAAFEKLVQPASASTLQGLIRQLPKIDRAADKFQKTVDDVTDEFLQLKGQLDAAVEPQLKHGTPPDQVLVNRTLLNSYKKASRRLQQIVALQESERQFQEWLVWRIAALVNELTDAEQSKPVAAVAAGLRSSDWRYRLRCAELLARMTSTEARAAFQKAIEGEADPMILAELIRIRAASGGGDLLGLLKARLSDERWPIRAAVVRELGKIPKKEVIDLLVAQLEKEEGRLRDDITAALRALTGQRFQPEPEPWKVWWGKMRDKWAPRRPGEELKAGEDAAAQAAGNVYFYGIRTSSKRLVFCIDFSGSMAFPLDGKDGKGEPRIETARRELFRAFTALPEDAMFNVVVYSVGVTKWKRGMQPATLHNKQAARKFVERQQPAGGTNIFDALMESLDVAASGKHKKRPRNAVPEADTILFLTDGMPTAGRVVDPHQIITEITKRNELLGVTIHTVGVSKEQNAAFLLNLAKKNGGRYVGRK